MFQIPSGCTDCALPVLWASENEKLVDVFIIFTNNEAWFGQANPLETLRMYRHVRVIQLYDEKLFENSFHLLLLLVTSNGCVYYAENWNILQVDCVRIDLQRSVYR